MSMLDRIQGLLQDPPPEFAFEIGADGIAMSRTRPPATVQATPLAGGVLSPSPVKENILDAAAYAEAVKKVMPPANSRGRRTAALILPDYSLRLAVLEFENIPQKETERVALLRFRLRKTVPFEIDEAALAYHVQPGNSVVAAITPAGTVVHYEAPFRAAGMHPGFVTASSLALLELLPPRGFLLVANLAPGALSVLAIKDGIVQLARSLELGESVDDPLDEISSDLYPTLVYLEDQTGARPEKLILSGFGADSASAAMRLSIELEIEAEILREKHAGLAGYLASLARAKSLPAKTIARKVAA
jgi:type IV pilus assembly protein PilM